MLNRSLLRLFACPTALRKDLSFAMAVCLLKRPSANEYGRAEIHFTLNAEEQELFQFRCVPCFLYLPACRGVFLGASFDSVTDISLTDATKRSRGAHHTNYFKNVTKST